jgi:hypothetical protein
VLTKQPSTPSRESSSFHLPSPFLETEHHPLPFSPLPERKVCTHCCILSFSRVHTYLAPRITRAPSYMRLSLSRIAKYFSTALRCKAVRAFVPLMRLFCLSSECPNDDTTLVSTTEIDQLCGSTPSSFFTHQCGSAATKVHRAHELQNLSDEKVSPP